MKIISATLALALAACISAGERPGLDDEVGVGEAPPLAVRAVENFAQLRELSPTGAVMWVSAPELSIEIENGGTTDTEFDLTLLNATAATEFSATLAGAPHGVLEVERTRPTERQARLDVPAMATVTVTLALPAEIAGPFRVAVMGDIQTALDSVDEVFDAISDVENLDFVISTGDIVESARENEFDLFDAQLQFLRIPFYSTIGNHEIRGDHEIWHRRYGLYSLYFVYRDVAFSFIDSGNGGIHPTVGDRLQRALDEHRDRIHLVGTHYPPFDPIGVRSGSFRSRKEAAAFLARLADGRVDTTFYGHIHSFYAYENAGIPAYISGGGGASPERWDGIGRHFLVLTINPNEGSTEVGLVRVD